MALVTDRLVTEETAFLEVTYDDVTLDLVTVHAVVTEETTIRIFQANGNVFRDVVVEPPVDLIVNFPAGPIRTLDDLNSFGLVVT